jgi:hypothetical protein
VRRTPWTAWLDGKPEWQTILDVGAIDLNTDPAASASCMLTDFICCRKAQYGSTSMAIRAIGHS